MLTLPFRIIWFITRHLCATDVKAKYEEGYWHGFAEAFKKGDDIWQEPPFAASEGEEVDADVDD